MSKSKRKKAAIAQGNFEKNELKIKESGLVFLSKGYKNLYLCPKCGNTMRIKRKTLVKNPICRNCMLGQSFGEEKVIEVLTRLKLFFQKEKTFRGLKGLKGKRLRFDFHIKGKDRYFLLEVDGDQHRIDTTWGGSTKDHDKIKEQFCKSKGINLYRISYKYGKLEKLEKDLMRILKEELGEEFFLPFNQDKLSDSKNNCIGIDFRKDVFIYAKSYFNNDLKLGSYFLILEYKGFKKQLSKENIESISVNRVMLEGIISAVKMLKQPCNITIYSPGSFGAKTFINRITGEPKAAAVRSIHNKDLKEELRHLLLSGNHRFINVLNNELVEQNLKSFKEMSLELQSKD